MSRMHTFSKQMIDYGERLSKMADAAEGKGHSSTSRIGRWLVLPAVGAGAYALARSEFFSRQAKEVLDEAKTRAADIPDDLMSRVQQATNGTTTKSRSARSSSQSGRKNTTKKRAKSGTR